MMRNEEDDDDGTGAGLHHEKDMINHLFYSAKGNPLVDNQRRGQAQALGGEEDYGGGEGINFEDIDEDEDGGEHHPFYLPQGITEIDDSELEELLYSSEDDDSDGAAVGLDGGVGGGVLPHSAKYQALSLRASRGHDQQSGSLPHYQSAGELTQYHHPLDEVSQQPPVPFHQHHDQQHGSSAHQYYNYFEGDSESGDNSHTSLPWAPGLPQHVSEAEDVLYRSAGSLFTQDFADILQSRAKTSASTGDIPLYVASPNERIVDNGRINAGGLSVQKRQQLDMEIAGLQQQHQQQQHYHHQLDREWERERKWELMEKERERQRRNSYDAPSSTSSAIWSRAVGGDAQGSVYRQQQHHHGGSGSGGHYHSSGSLGGIESATSHSRPAEKAVNKSTPSLPVSGLMPTPAPAAPKSAPLPQEKKHAPAAAATAQPPPGPLSQGGSTVKLTPPIYNTPSSSQHQKKTVWKQRSPPTPPQHQAPGTGGGGSAPNAGTAPSAQAIASADGAIGGASSTSGSGPSQPQVHAGQLPNPQRSPVRQGTPGSQHQHQPMMLPPGVRALSPPRSPTRSGARGVTPNSNLPQEYVSRPRPRQNNNNGGNGNNVNNNNNNINNSGNAGSQRALFPSLPQGMQQGLFPQPPPPSPVTGRNMGAHGPPKPVYFAGSSAPNLPTYMPPPQVSGRRGMPGVGQQPPSGSGGIPVAIAPFGYPPFAFASSASMPSLPAMHGGLPNFPKPMNFPPQPSILGAKYHGGGAMRIAPNFPPPGPYVGHSHQHHHQPQPQQQQQQQQQQSLGRDHRKEQQKEREREREKEKEQQQKERETQKRKPKGMWKVKNRQPQPAAATSDDPATGATTAATASTPTAGGGSAGGSPSPSPPPTPAASTPPAETAAAGAGPGAITTAASAAAGASSGASNNSTPPSPARQD